MPTTLASILVVIFGVLPGVPGDKIYRLLIGWDWREDRLQRLLRLLVFSLLGLAGYSVVSGVFALPAPTYLSPQNLQYTVVHPAALPSLFIALLGHFFFSGLSGLLGAVGARLLERFSALSAYPGTWDHFVLRAVPNHWVIAALENGDAYLGMLEAADTSVAHEERDVILSEPSKYDPEIEQYEPSNFQFLFIPGSFISSMGVIYDPDIDTRTTALQREDDRHGKKKEVNVENN